MRPDAIDIALQLAEAHITPAHTAESLRALALKVVRRGANGVTDELLAMLTDEQVGEFLSARGYLVVSTIGHGGGYAALKTR